MAGFDGVVVSNPWLQNQFTQVELRSLKSAAMSKLKIAGDDLTEDETAALFTEAEPDLDCHVDFELLWTAKVPYEDELKEAIKTAMGTKEDCLCFIESQRPDGQNVGEQAGDEIVAKRKGEESKKQPPDEPALS